MSHIFRCQRWCFWSVPQVWPYCCWVYSAFDRWRDLESTPTMSKFDVCQSSFLRAPRHFIWHMTTRWSRITQITKPACFNQFFLCKIKVWRRTNPNLRQHFAQQRYKRYPKCAYTIVSSSQISLKLTWIFNKEHIVARIFYIRQVSVWTYVNATILT